MPMLTHETDVLKLLQNKKSVLLISLSGGKDADAMLTEVWAWAHRHNISPDRIHSVTADLQRNEWDFAMPHIQSFSKILTGKAPIVVTRPQGDVLQQWEDRYAKLQTEGRTTVAPWSDSQNRFCTSGAKRAQIHKAIVKHFPRDTVIVQCVGLRADESTGRKSANPLKYHAKSPTAPTLNRHVYTWLPIHKFSVEDVWNTLGWSIAELELLQEDVKQRVTPGDYEALEQVSDEWGHKWGRAYALGNFRLSCRICPLASQHDLLNGIAWNPDHFRDISDLERRSGFSFQPKQWLSDLGLSHLDDREQAELDEAKQHNLVYRQQQKQQKKPNQPQQLTLF